MTQTTQEHPEFGWFAPSGAMKLLVAATRRCSSTWSGKRCAFLLRGIALKLFPARPFDVLSFNIKMRLYPYNNTCEKRLVFTPQYYDFEEREYLAGWMRDDFVFIDVGANVGGYALFVASLAGPGARVLAIEPQPDIYERLIYNIRENAFTAIKAVDCAVADKAGEVTFFVASRNSGESSMKLIEADSYENRISVTAKTLLQLIEDEQFDHVDAVKLDAEGAEDIILEPFFQHAPRELWPTLVLLEHNPADWSFDVEEMLRRFGYREEFRTRLNRAWVRTN
jgi:FkbM family methyltransferase